MAFSIRDIQKLPGPLNNQSGQGIVEYILVLVVTVSLVLGGLYTLNTAFKSWAENYFGNYIACLLESGELPNIQGGGGDGGICNEIFKPFSLAEGRPLNPGYKAPGGKTAEKGAGSREAGPAGYKVAGGGGGYGGGGGGSFSGDRDGGGGGKNKGAGGKKGGGGNYTGSMAASDYGSDGGGSNKRINVGVKQRLDNRFAFEDERETAQRKRVASAGRRPADEFGQAGRIRVKREDVKKSDKAQEDTGLTLPNLLKYLIIAGILIALLVFLGGQGLQIGKSME